MQRILSRRYNLLQSCWETGVIPYLPLLLFLPFLACRDSLPSFVYVFARHSPASFVFPSFFRQMALIFLPQSKHCSFLANLKTSKDFYSFCCDMFFYVFLPPLDPIDLISQTPYSPISVACTRLNKSLCRSIDPSVRQAPQNHTGR